MQLSSRSYYILGAQDAGGMRYLAGPIALSPSVEAAMPFPSPELASALLDRAAGLRPELEWRVLRACAEIRVEAL